MTDWIADGESGASVRSKLNAIRGKGTSEIVTTGASTVHADPNVDVTYITTGGTGGNEDIILDKFALNGDGYNAEKDGVIHTIILQTRTNSGDTVRVFTGSVGNPLEIKDDAGVTIAESDVNGGKLHGHGTSIDLVWRSYEWFAAIDNGANTTNWKYKRYPLADGSSDGQVSSWNDSTKQVEWRDPAGGGGTALTDAAGAPITADAVIAGVLGNSQIVSTGADPLVINSGFREARIVTGGTAGTENASLDSTGLSVDFIGVQLLLVELARIDPADVISLDPTNIKTALGVDISSITFTGASQYLLLENWDGAVWRVVRGTATVT